MIEVKFTDPSLFNKYITKVRNLGVHYQQIPSKNTVFVEGERQYLKQIVS